MYQKDYLEVNVPSWTGKALQYVFYICLSYRSVAGMKYHDQDNSSQKEFNQGITYSFRGLVHVPFSGMWWQAGMSLEQ